MSEDKKQTPSLEPFSEKEIELAMNFAIQNEIEKLVMKWRPNYSTANVVEQTHVLARKVAERILSADEDEQLY